MYPHPAPSVSASPEPPVYRPTSSCPSPLSSSDTRAVAWVVPRLPLGTATASESATGMATRLRVRPPVLCCCCPSPRSSRPTLCTRLRPPAEYRPVSRIGAWTQYVRGCLIVCSAFIAGLNAVITAEYEAAGSAEVLKVDSGGRLSLAWAHVCFASLVCLAISFFWVTYGCCACGGACAGATPTPEPVAGLELSKAGSDTTASPPDGWSRHADPDTGALYLFHEAIGETKWEPAAEGGVAASASEQGHQENPMRHQDVRAEGGRQCGPSWSRHRDPGPGGSWCSFNSVETGESIWAVVGEGEGVGVEAGKGERAGASAGAGADEADGGGKVVGWGGGGRPAVRPLWGTAARPCIERHVMGSVGRGGGKMLPLLLSIALLLPGGIGGAPRSHPLSTVRTVMARCPSARNRSDPRSDELSQPPAEHTAVARVFSDRLDLCSSPKNAGPWSLLPVKAADAVTETLRVLGNMTNGSSVLDWGSGCGHRLHHFAQEFDLEGIGIELAAPLTEWANAHRSGDGRVMFCEGDGTNMSWIPDASFDFSFSVGSVFFTAQDCRLVCTRDGTHCEPEHKTCASTCRAVREMVRVTKPGGAVVVDHLDMSFPMSSWASCLMGLHVDRSDELSFATVPSHQLHDWNGAHWYGETFYALVVAKRHANGRQSQVVHQLTTLVTQPHEWYTPTGMPSRLRNAGMPRVSVPVLPAPSDLPAKTVDHSLNLRLDINVTGVDIPAPGQSASQDRIRQLSDRRRALIMCHDLPGKYFPSFFCGQVDFLCIFFDRSLVTS